MSERWFIGQFAYGFIQQTMKDKILIQSRPLRERLYQKRLLIFAWNAGIREYSCGGLMASQWQMFNP
jgi:hypothetical protein